MGLELLRYLSDRLGTEYRDRGVSSTGGVKLEKITQIHMGHRNHRTTSSNFLHFLSSIAFSFTLPQPGIFHKLKDQVVSLELPSCLDELKCPYQRVSFAAAVCSPMSSWFGQVESLHAKLDVCNIEIGNDLG